MGIQLSKRAEYGLRAIIQLATVWPERITRSREICRQTGLPDKLLKPGLLSLCQSGFVESTPGRNGGFRLSRSPRQILIGDIVRQLESKRKPDDNRDLRRVKLARDEAGIRYLNACVSTAVADVLDHITLEQLLEEIWRLCDSESLTYDI